MTTEASTTPFEGEVDDELHTPEVLAPGEEVIDGDFIIDSKGLKRLRDGRLLPGQALNPNGRPKGSGTGLRYREFKQSMVLAFHQNGGTAWLARWGLQNPSQFFRLMSRMLPHEFQGELTHSGAVRLLMTLPRTALDDALPGQETNNTTLIIDEDGNVVQDVPASALSLPVARDH